MRRKMFLAAVAAVLLAGSGATVQAYFLDAPHNESNGITCESCHNADWQNYNPTGGIDDTQNNYLCGRCHDPDSPNPDLSHRGPLKQLHSSATTGSAGTWTTGCTQCHEPHFQEQKAWAADPDLVLAQGNFDNVGSPPPAYVSGDPLGGGYGTTSVNINSVSGAWSDTSTWNKKGGYSLPGRASDVSRGLILIHPTTGETYEIVDVTGNVLKVKGQMLTAPHGLTFKVIYGQSLRASIIPPGAIQASDARDVKFFKPTIGGVGGYVDESPTAEPVGVCQVCHTQTNSWNNDEVTDVTPLHNPLDQPCNDCHNLVTGGAGGAEHPAFIQDRLANGCNNCHPAHVADPGSGHAGGCETCHTATRPEINTNIMTNDGGGTVLANLQDASGYAGGTTGQRLTYNGFGIASAGAGFQIIDCSDCHEVYGVGGHATHSSTAFGWDGNCDDCHGPNTLEVVADIHNDDCTVCHDPTAVAAGYYNIRREGDPAYGIDGDARGATTASGCTDCHNTNTPGVIHHTSATGYAGNSNCTVCHGTAGHKGDHTALVADYGNCTGCHLGNVGGGVNVGAPVSAVDSPNLLHDSCVTCHNTNTTLKTKSQADTSTPDKISAMPNGGTGTSNGGGTCLACHGEYFASHRNIDHTVKVGGATACVSCHTATAGTATTVPLGPTNAKVHDACSTCHETSGQLKAGYGTATSMASPGGVCTDCHGAYFPNHANIGHTTRVSGAAVCIVCHDATADTGSGVPLSGGDDEVHDACNTCHNDATNNLLKAGYGTAASMASPGGNCTFCHGSYFDSHTHHAVNNEVTFSVTTDVTLGGSGCYLCHDDANLGKGTGALGTWAAIYQEHETIDSVGYNPCQVCHYYTTNRSGDPDTPPVATVTSVIGASGPTTCVTCHEAKDGPNPHGSHTDTEFGWNSTTQASCGDDGRTAGACHGNDVGNPVISGVHGDNCGLCHEDEPNNNYTRISGDDGNAALASGRAAVCTECHTATKPYMHHDHNVNLSVNYNPLTDCATLCHISANSAAGNHTGLVGTVALCVTCHTGAVGSANNVPVASGDDMVHDACTQCHKINATTKVVELVDPSNPPLTYVTTMDNSDTYPGSTSNGGGPCTDCHTAYFEAHTHHETQNEVAINKTGPTYDVSWQANSPCDFAGCHYDYDVANSTSLGLSTWTTIRWEHDLDGTKDGTGGCMTCHGATRSANVWNYADVPNVIATGTSVQCLNCHYDKQAPSNHGMEYRDHLTINTVAGQGALGYPPVKANNVAGNLECSVCHAFDLVTNGGPDLIMSEALHGGPGDTKKCGDCHTNQPLLKDSLPDLTLKAGLGGYTCIDCHFTANNTGFLIAFHEIIPDNDTILARHDNIGDAGCFACHTEMTSPKLDVLSRHMVNFVDVATTPNECNVCHAPFSYSGGSIADSPSLGVIFDGKTAGTTGGNDNPQTCASCHTWDPATPVYRTHALTNADAQSDSVHNNINSDAACAPCHSIADELAILTTHAGGCTSCHAYSGSAPAGVAATAISNGMSSNASPTMQNCVTCHAAAGAVGVNGAYGMHEMTNATVEAAHNNLEGSSAPGTAADCEACHSAGGATVEERRLALHPLCTTCHGFVDGIADVQIASGLGAGLIYCENCHNATNQYQLHEMTEADVADAILHNNINTDAACTGCHTMGSQLEKLQLHASDCRLCHAYTLSAPAGTAATAIINGESANASPAAQNCVTCHAAAGAVGVDGAYGMHEMTDASVATAHNRLATPNYPAEATSSCGTASCHAIATPLARIQLHTTSGTTTCVECHSWNANVKTVIGTGVGVGGSDVNCEDCHSTATIDAAHNHGYDWYVHLDPGHSATILVDNTATGSPNVDNCVDCHNEATQVAVHDSVPTPVGGSQACTECHDVDSALQGSATVYTSGAFECNQCHTAYFDGHTTRGTGSSGHTTALNTNPTIAVGDWAQGTGSEQLCYDCHYDSQGSGNSTALDTWNEILVEHQTVAGTGGQNACEVCHNSTYADVDTVAFPGATTVQDVISAGGSVRCLSCHYSKRSPNGHGGHDASHFDWTGATTTSCGNASCHNSATTVATQVHPACIICHNDPDNAAGGNNNTGLGDLGVGTAEITTNGGPADATTHTEDCYACHSVAGHLYQTDFGNAHLRTTDHDGVEINAGCMGSNACHQGSTGATVAATLHTTCTACHTNTGTDGNFTSGPTGDATGGSGDCASCHSAPVNYTANYTNHQTPSHAAMTNTATCVSGGCHDQSNYVDAGQPGVGVHDMFDNASATYACDLCHTTVTGLLKNGSRGYGDATDTVGQCTNCHSAYTTWDTGHDAANLDHAALTDTPSCVSANCHTQSDYIDAGQPGVGVHDMYDNASATFACDRCHNLANGVLEAGPNGSGTAVGGAGNCADCHSGINTDFAAGTGHAGYTHTDITLTTGCSTAACHSGDIITAVHLACGSCHLDVTTPTTDGSLIGSAAAANPAANGSATQFECMDCHTAGHDAEADHNNIHKTWTDGTSGDPDNGATQSCYSCHSQMGGATVTFVGGIDQLHLRGNVTCDSCHNYSGTRTGTLAADVAQAIQDGKSTGGNTVVNCESCHDFAGITSHDAVNAHNRTMLETGKYESEGLSCGRCHHGNVAVEHVMGGAYCTNLAYTDQNSCETNGYFWNSSWGVAKGKIEGWDTPPANKCTVCHDDGAGGSSSNTVVNAAVTLGKSTGGDSPVGCYQCHNSTNTQLFNYDPDSGGPLQASDPKYGAGYTIPRGHHDGTQVQLGNCTYCHTDPRVKMGFPTPAVLPCKDCHADENASGSFTIYKTRNRGQQTWDTKGSLSGSMASTLTFGAICSNTNYATKTACEGATPPGIWQPARPTANTLPDGTCSDSQYDNDKWECINNSGTWTSSNDAALPGHGVDHQWTIPSGRGGNPGQVQTYGMCIFCHKMAGFHAKNVPAAIDSNSNAIDSDWTDGYSDPQWWNGPGRTTLAVFQESAGLENAFYNTNPYKGSQSGDKSQNKKVSGVDGYPAITYHFEQVSYQPQRICSDSKWKSYTDCNNNGGTWDHGAQAKKYIPLSWRYDQPGLPGANEQVLKKIVPIISAKPTVDTLTNNGTALTSTGDGITGAITTGNVTSSFCNAASKCDVYMIYAGIQYPLTWSSPNVWSGSTGAIANVGAVYSKEDVWFVSIDKATGQTIGGLDVQF